VLGAGPITEDVELSATADVRGTTAIHVVRACIVCCSRDAARAEREFDPRPSSSVDVLCTRDDHREDHAMPVYTYTTLDDPLAVGGTGAWGINSTGQIVGLFRNFGGTHGFLYSGGTYTPIDDPFATSFTAALGINNLGQIVGQYNDASSHGFLLSSGIFTSLNHPLATNGTEAAGINGAGQIVGSYNIGGTSHGFLYDLNSGTYTAILDDPSAGSLGTVATGMNDAGQVVGFYFENTTARKHGFLFTPHPFAIGGTYTTLDHPFAAPASTIAQGINNAGQIVGYYGDSNGKTHGFLYSGGSYITIDDPLNTDLSEALDINSAGQIVGVYNNATGLHGFLLTITPNPSPPAGTTATMILRGSNASPSVAGQYEIYDIGNNSLLAAYQLGQVGTEWQFATLGRFFDGDTSDMLLRNTSTGGFEVYDISNNLIIGAAFLGTVGLNWQVNGFGDFNQDAMTDMLLRNSSTGGLEVYNISNNSIINAAFLGSVGLDWQFSGIGNFSGVPGGSDLLLRNVNTGGLEVYDIAHNQITGAAFLGTVGLDWQFSGIGNFSGTPGGSDLLLRNVNTGGLEVYNIANNQIIGAAFIGTIGLDWQYAGIAPVHAAGASDLVLRNVNTGTFQVYNIANNHLTGSAPLGQVGSDWQVGGFAPTFSTAPPFQPAETDGSTAQLVQAMAGFGDGSGAGESLNTVPLGADTSQQTFLTTPQHA
jgi:probable HAF family extracellular repeat protein